MKNKPLNQYLKSLRQHEEDIDYIFDHLEELPKDSKTFLLGLLKERPQIANMLDIDFEYNHHPYHLLEEKIDYLTTHIKLLERNIFWDSMLSNIKKDITSKRKKVYLLKKRLEAYKMLEELDK